MAFSKLCLVRSCDRHYSILAPPSSLLQDEVPVDLQGRGVRCFSVYHLVKCFLGKFSHHKRLSAS